MLARTKTHWRVLTVAALIVYVMMLWTWALGGFSEQGEICQLTAAGKDCESYNVLFATALKIAKAADHWSALITALATGAIAWFTAIIWTINKKQLQHAHRVERAYISCGGFGEFVSQVLTGPMGHPIQGRRFTGSFQVQVNNHGKTPGETFRFAIEFRDLGAVLPTEPVYSNFIYHHNWIGPGTQSRPLFPVPPPAGLRNPMIVYGRVWFRDIFSETEHSSGFYQDFNRETGDSQAILPPSRAYTDWDHDDP
jgi:hypothetical protein